MVWTLASSHSGREEFSAGVWKLVRMNAGKVSVRAVLAREGWGHGGLTAGWCPGS